MKTVKVLLGLMFLGCFAVVIFFGIQYINLSSENSSLKDEITGFDQEITVLNEQISTLKSRGEILVQRNDELAGEKIELQKQISIKALEVGTLERYIRNLEKEIEKINAPPVSTGASTPWERLQYSFELWEQGKWDKYWELMNSDFKERCSAENFVLQMLTINPPPPEFIFIDQATGKTRSLVWLSMNGRMVSQLFLFENGEWMIYGGNVSC